MLSEVWLSSDTHEIIRNNLHSNSACYVYNFHFIVVSTTRAINQFDDINIMRLHVRKKAQGTKNAFTKQETKVIFLFLNCMVQTQGKL
ncbi:hypothetical protein VTP01DRAFT_6565 [Rhizomucor pusillus]|uniref:uncharacterized protein n=1 Tax=Rhizomucor pusillus TaxID=4840 RepID=UPI003743BE79